MQVPSIRENSLVINITSSLVHVLWSFVLHSGYQSLLQYYRYIYVNNRSPAIQSSLKEGLFGNAECIAQTLPMIYTRLFPTH